MHYDVLVCSSCCEVLDVQEQRGCVYLHNNVQLQSFPFSIKESSQCLSQTTLLKINGVPYANSIDTAPQ